MSELVYHKFSLCQNHLFTKGHRVKISLSEKGIVIVSLLQQDDDFMP